MKLTKLVVTIAVLAASSSIYAADGQITFTGNINSSTCTINGEEGQSNQSVELADVPASSLLAAGSTSGNKSFAINLTGCVTEKSSVAAHFESISLGTTDGRLNLDTNSTAKNVEIAIYDDKGVMQPVNGVVPTSSYVALTGTEDAKDTATLNYVASYYSKGAAEAGTVSSAVSYTLSYQ